VKKPEEILEDYKAGSLDLAQAIDAINACFFQDMGHTTLDHDRARRTGDAEVILAEQKTPRQVADIFESIAQRGANVLATRASADQYAAVKAAVPGAAFHETARMITLKQTEGVQRDTSIAVVSAGTSDAAVAEEAAFTCEFYDNPVVQIRDVGVAGIHRLLARIDEIRAAKVVIVVAGMEGALPSVVGGLVDKPVIAVPTSVGYGAAFGGVTALLGMLTSCAAGVSVVNIDNGFGAGYLANQINRL
jgi:NCAIR mutase (PurE)-related protein